MGLFSSDKPIVTDQEYTKATHHVGGLSGKQRTMVDEMFEGSKDKDLGHRKGITADEIDERMESLRSTKSMHGISDQKMKEIEDALKSKL